MHACTSFFVFLYGKDKMSKTLNKQSYSELYPLKMGMEPMIKMIAHTFLAYALCGTHEPGRAKSRENLFQSLNDITLTIHVDHADT